jgi:galactokinase
MDMFASMMGKRDFAIRLDCRSMAFNYFPVNLQEYQFLLCDTQVSHKLADSAYNTRREECQTGVGIIQREFPETKSLRDVTMDQLEKIKEQLPGDVFKRCAYVVQENQRLIASCELLQKSDLPAFGKLLYGSHEGLSQSYEVSCPELDFLVAQTIPMEYVLGARMMGGGFGGCTLNLVKISEKEAFIAEIAAAYQLQFGILPRVYEVQVVDGTSLLN